MKLKLIHHWTAIFDSCLHTPWKIELNFNQSLKFSYSQFDVFLSISTYRSSSLYLNACAHLHVNETWLVNAYGQTYWQLNSISYWNVLFVISQLHDDTIRKLSREPRTQPNIDGCFLYELTSMSDSGGISEIEELIHSIK